MEYRSPLITEASHDPMGKAMWAYFRGNLKAKIKVYSDVAVDDNIPASYLFRTYSQMPKWEQQALELCQGKVLDIGAGAGSHSLELQNRGIEVKAIDISPGAVLMMKERGLKLTEHISFWELKEERFDTLLLLMNGIGLVGNLLGLNAFLEKSKMHLRDGAQIILDSSDIKYLYEDLEMAMPNDSYYGIIEYQMEFGLAMSKKFPWLYIDYPRLIRHCKLHGLNCQIITEGPHYEYLARIFVD